MIWVDGRIVLDGSLTVSVLDRTFEHGLGLFETFSARDGRAPLLDRHLARLKNSARELGLPFDSVRPPDEKAVADLLAAEGFLDARMLRVTLSGGRSDSKGAILWMRSFAPPPPHRREGAFLDVGSWRVLHNDPLAQHKCLNYWSRRLASESARRLGFDEVLNQTEDGQIWEGSRTNVFVVQGSTLITPWLAGPLVPGVMRGCVLELSSGLPLTCTLTGGLSLEVLEKTDEVFLTNSVRGIIPVAHLRTTNPTRFIGRWVAPGPWTKALMLLLSDRLGLHEGPST